MSSPGYCCSCAAGTLQVALGASALAVTTAAPAVAPAVAHVVGCRPDCRLLTVAVAVLVVAVAVLVVALAGDGLCRRSGRRHRSGRPAGRCRRVRSAVGPAVGVSVRWSRRRRRSGIDAASGPVVRSGQSRRRHRAEDRGRRAGGARDARPGRLVPPCTALGASDRAVRRAIAGRSVDRWSPPRLRWRFPPTLRHPAARRIWSIMSAFFVRELVFRDMPGRWPEALPALCPPIRTARAAARQSSVSSLRCPRSVGGIDANHRESEG